MISTAAQFDRAKSRALVAVQSRLVAVAKNRHAAVMAREPRPAGFVRIVDGRIGALEEVVRVYGTIRYIYDRLQVGFERDPKATIARLDEIARFALETLRASSPVGAGDDPHAGLYRDSHKLFLNGYPVDDLSGWREGDEISIANYVAYSRILEVGDGKARLPNFVYQNAADVVAEKYENFARIMFDWRGIVDGNQIAQDPRERRGFGVRVAASRHQHNKGEVRYPTIVISPLHPAG